MTARPVDLLGTLLADVEALDGAACTGAPSEFVDVLEVDAEQLVRAYCYRCTVVGRCREVGDALMPHAHPSVYGGRLYRARKTESVAADHRRTA